MDAGAKGILLLFWCFVGMFFAVFAYLWFDDAGNCNSSGNVWDYAEKRCREDCLTWNKVNGCIYMDEEYSRLFYACGQKSKLCDKQKFDELRFKLCQQYQGAWQLDDKYCDFEFVKEKCGKLPGNWQYPEICA